MSRLTPIQQDILDFVNEHRSIDITIEVLNEETFKGVYTSLEIWENIDDLNKNGELPSNTEIMFGRRFLIPHE